MKLALIIIIVIELIGYCFGINENKCFKFGHSCKDKKLKCFSEINNACERGLQCLPSTPFNYDDDDGFGDFEIDSPKNLTCINAGYAGDGEFCQSDYNCIGTRFYNLKCIYSKCQLYGMELYKNITCIDYYNCPGASTCASLGFDNGNYISKCVPLKSDCKTQSECSLVVYVQVKINCETTIYHYFPNGAFNSSEEINKCVPLVYSKTTNCLEEGCQEYEFCNGATNKCYPRKKYTNDCKKAEKERDSCYISNNCFFSNEQYDLLSSDSPFSNENSCQMKYCKCQTINYFKINPLTKCI
ncbi:hypothetical protein ACTFIY_008299 [Dictyostelium cf. discoideum]